MSGVRAHRPVGAAFLLLVIAQAAHSVEECVYRLYDVFAPASYVASLVSGDPATGFALANTGIVLVGLWCWAAGVRTGRAWGLPAAWAWAVVETANGIGHLGIAAWRGQYFPGVATAPLLLATALYLMRRLSMPSTVSGVSTPPAP
jgi:hypothetical protein